MKAARIQVADSFPAIVIELRFEQTYLLAYNGMNVLNSWRDR